MAQNAPKGMKIILIAAIVLADVLGIGIIPLNLFVVGMPVYISMVISIFIFLLNVFYWILPEIHICTQSGRR